MLTGSVLWSPCTPCRSPLLTRVHIACRGGRHRSVAVAEEIARELRREGIGVEVCHRDINKPVVER